MRAPTLSRPFARRAALVTFLSAALSTFLVAAPPGPRRAWAGDPLLIYLEAEEFSGCFDGGREPIAVIAEPVAPGGQLVVTGVDTTGDYIEWRLNTGVPRVFYDSLCTAASVGTRVKFAILFLPADGSGPPIIGDTLTTKYGSGIECPGGT